MEEKAYEKVAALTAQLNRYRHEYYNLNEIGRAHV